MLEYGKIQANVGMLEYGNMEKTSDEYANVGMWEYGNMEKTSDECGNVGMWECGNNFRFLHSKQAF